MVSECPLPGNGKTDLYGRNGGAKPPDGNRMVETLTPRRAAPQSTGPRCQISVCSASPKASSMSTPKYLTVFSIFV